MDPTQGSLSRVSIARIGTRFRVACMVVAVAVTLTACEVKGPTSATTADSTSGATKNVKINWNASHAVDVGLTGGGYKVYIRKGSTPTTSNTTPIVITNPGGGTHTTTLTTPLASGKYYIAIASFSTNGDSPLSTAFTVTVP